MYAHHCQIVSTDVIHTLSVCRFTSFLNDKLRCYLNHTGSRFICVFRQFCRRIWVCFFARFVQESKIYSRVSYKKSKCLRAFRTRRANVFARFVQEEQMSSRVSYKKSKCLRAFRTRLRPFSHCFCTRLRRFSTKVFAVLCCKWSNTLCMVFAKTILYKTSEEPDSGQIDRQIDRYSKKPRTQIRIKRECLPIPTYLER